MDMPPSRYKVVERGRRLVVIDTLSGAPVSPVDAGQRERIAALEHRQQSSAPVRTAQPPPSSSPIMASAQGLLTTQRWFDDKAPRRVRLRQDNQGMASVVLLVLFVVPVVAFLIFGWPILLFLGVVLTQKAVRALLRGMVTRWLDGMDQVAG